MAFDQTTLKKLSGAEQIIVLQSLTQLAAAWLLDTTARTLRDHVEVPRDANGAYTARELLASGLKTTELSEPTVDELEKMWLIAESLQDDDRIPAAIRLLNSLRARYGEAGLAMFSTAMLESWTLNGPEKTEQEVRDKLEGKFQKDLERAQYDRLSRQLKVVRVCYECHRVRRGRAWVKTDIPAGFTKEAGDAWCPDCHRKLKEARLTG